MAGLNRSLRTDELVSLHLATIMGRAGDPPKTRSCYFMTKQLLLLWPPIRRFSLPSTGEERRNGGNLRQLSRKISSET
jgi:hypothetical protein